MKLIHYITILSLVMIDQLTKHYVMQLNDVIVVNDFCNIVFVKNFGISFGIMNKPDEFITRVLISLMTILITIYLCIIAKRNANVYMWIIAGAIGNLIDRVHLGFVVDFIDCHIAEKHWPAFNIADSCVCFGVFLLLFMGNKCKVQK